MILFIVMLWLIKAFVLLMLPTFWRNKDIIIIF